MTACGNLLKTLTQSELLDYSAVGDGLVWGRVLKLYPGDL